MTTIVMTSSVNKTDGAIKKKLWAFIEKLSQNDEMVGLHIEPMNNPRDARVRTGRVDDNFRAVLFRLEGGGPQRTYVYMEPGSMTRRSRSRDRPFCASTQLTASPS